MGTETPQTTAFPGATSVGPEGSPEAQAEALAQLGAGVGQAAAAEAQQALGEPLDYQKLRDDPESLGDALNRLSKAWDGTWDRFSAIFAPLGKKSSELAAAVASTNEPGNATEHGYEEIEPLAIAGKAYENALHARDALARNPTWLDFIRAACNRRTDEAGNKLPPSLMIAFIEMESSFNPHARPLDPETKKPLSSAVGLAQALKGSADEYRREVKPDANMEDPATAIDFMNFHILKKIAAVNRLIAQSKPEDGFKPQYRLSAKSDTEHLYLAYHDGEKGYLVLRRYLDNPTPENHEKLTIPQKTKYKKKNGEEEGWKRGTDYAFRVDAVQKEYEFLQENNGAAVAFEHPPLPAQYAAVSSPHGPRFHPVDGEHHNHGGIDLPAPMGTPVYAVNSGTVESVVSMDPRGGNMVRIKHAKGSTIYCHLSSMDVRSGQEVRAGQTIGKVGNTGGKVSGVQGKIGYHLHLEFRDNKNRTLDPAPRVAASFVRQRSIAA